MRLLVTGGVGFIGSHVVEHALIAGYEVAVFDNFASGNVLPDVRTFWGDIRDRDRVFGALGAYGPTHVIHLAAWTDAPGSISNPREHFENNVMGSINVIDACVGVCVERLVFASSAGAIYGDTGSGFATEKTLPNPENPYGAGKLAVEHLLACACRNSDLTSASLRYPNVYGPRARSGVIATFMRAALRGQELRVFGSDEGGMRTYAFVDDIAKANMQALRGFSEYCAVDVAGGGYATTGELARTIKEMSRSNSPIVNCGKRNGDVALSRIAGDLFLRGYEGTVTGLNLGLEKTLEWWKQHEDKSGLF